MNFSVRTDLNIDELESLCIEIRKPYFHPFIVVNWYRPRVSSLGLFNRASTIVVLFWVTVPKR